MQLRHGCWVSVRRSRGTDDHAIVTSAPTDSRALSQDGMREDAATVSIVDRPEQGAPRFAVAQRNPNREHDHQQKRRKSKCQTKSLSYSPANACCCWSIFKQGSRSV